MLLAGLWASACGGGSAEQKLNRINFLSKHGKKAEALAFAKEAHKGEEGKARSRILMEGAAIAFQLYSQHLQKSYLKEMFALLEIVIAEKLPDAAEAFVMASQAHLALGNTSKAIEYVRKAVDIAPDKKLRGKYYKEVVDIYYRERDYRKTISECNYLMSAFPDYEGIEQIQLIKKSCQDDLAKMEGR